MPSFETASLFSDLSVPPKSPFDWINPIEPQSVLLSGPPTPTNALDLVGAATGVLNGPASLALNSPSISSSVPSLSPINSLPLSSDGYFGPLTSASNPSGLLGSAMSSLSSINSLPPSSDSYIGPLTSASNPSGLLGSAMSSLSPINSLPPSSDGYLGPLTSALNPSGVLDSGMSQLSSTESLLRSNEILNSTITPGLGWPSVSVFPGSSQSSESSAANTNILGASLGSLPGGFKSSEINWNSSSLMTTNPLLAGEVYKSTLASLPRPINFLDPFAPLPAGPLHISSIETSWWPTSIVGLGNPDTALVDVFEASRLTTLTNDLLLPCATAKGPAASIPFEPAFRDFQDASKNYATFIQAAKASTFESMLIAIPARGYFASGDALLQFQRNWPISVPLQRTRESTREEIRERTESKLELLLKKIDARLPKLWRGARMISVSTNPDKTRYASVSLRELMTQVLHILAPDAEIRRWTSDPRYFHNGKPTREIRLLYICQPIANGALSDFIRADIRSVIALGNVLQEGTHGIDADFSALELRLIFNRIEGALCSLIEISEASG
jgi:predicted pPIWI-associating nuclease